MKLMMSKQMQKGFILFITLIMLIIFAIVGIGLYQQTTISTINVQYITFKQEAEDLAMKALNEIEDQVKGNKYTKRGQCGELDRDGNPQPMTELERQKRCDPILDSTINTALKELKEKQSTLTGDWTLLPGDNFKGTFSHDGNVYYIVQQLGPDQLGPGGSNIGYLLYRITLIAQVLDTYNVISSVTAVPEND